HGPIEGYFPAQVVLCTGRARGRGLARPGEPRLVWSTAYSRQRGCWRRPASWERSVIGVRLSGVRGTRSGRPERSKVVRVRQLSGVRGTLSEPPLAPTRPRARRSQI